MRLLFIGDVVGKPGRRAVAELLPRLRTRYRPDVVIANGENAAGGVGLTEPVAEELFGLGIDILTSGNHIWDKAEAIDLLDKDQRVIRPANYPPGVPGFGSTVVKGKTGWRVGVINVAGRVFSTINFDCPFRTAAAELDALAGSVDATFVDVHAEASSEKVALGWYLDGRASAVVGTHTHVQTADARILPRGTAYMTDAGMTGPYDSVIGIRTDLVVNRFLYQMPVRFEVARGRRQLSGVVIDIERDGGRASSISAVHEVVGEDGETHN